MSLVVNMVGPLKLSNDNNHRCLLFDSYKLDVFSKIGIMKVNKLKGPLRSFTGPMPAGRKYPV